MTHETPVTLKLAHTAGLLLLICGIGALLLVLVELWLLYRDPAGILPLAQAIDSVGGLDGTLLGLTTEEERGPLPVAQILAWILAVVLLASMGRIAYWAIRAGALLIALPESARETPAAPAPSAREITFQDEELPEDYRPSHRQRKSDVPSVMAPARPKRTLR